MRAIALGLVQVLGGLALIGCQRTPPPLSSCKDSLAGLWRAEPPPGATEDPRHAERWAILDRGARLEIYPLFDDGLVRPGQGAADGAITFSPRSLELLRSHASLLGRVQRWAMRGAQKCELSASARISECRGDTLSAQLAELPPPGDFSSCPVDTRPPLASVPARTWRRER